MFDSNMDINSQTEVVPVRRAIRLWKTTLAKELVMADSTGTQLTGEAALIRAIILRRLFRSRVLSPAEINVGLLIPPSVPGALANFALTMDGRVAVNLNYSLNNDMLNLCVKKAELKHIITSRKVMEKFDFHFDCELVYLEDFVPQISLYNKLVSFFQAKFLSLNCLYKILKLDKLNPDDTMAILFTSGTTGSPKGVMLSHRNIGMNTISCEEYFHLTSDDRMLSVLPTFHSMGYMATLWACMAIGMRASFHFSPLDRRTIAKLCRQYGPTIVCGTPTFLRLYYTGLEPEDLKACTQIISGAERCPVSLMDEFEKRFNVRPVQGYGITETAPVISANISKKRLRPTDPLPKDASIGLPLPHIKVEIRDLETGELCPPEKSGLIWVCGPNVMKGYYNQPEETLRVIKDGWYNTGDMGYKDTDGYIYITGRLNRFAKIGGEMVPFEKIEDELNSILEVNQEQELKIAVTAVADKKRGEKIIVLYTELSKTPSEITAELICRKFPSLWIPGEKAYHKIEAIPLLGTGKLDLMTLKQLAQNLENTDQDET